MVARFQALHALRREARSSGQTHTCADAQVQLHSCHRHESASWHQQQTAKKLTGVNKMSNRQIEMLCLIGLTILAMLGIVIGFNGDGYLSKTCLIVSGMVLGMVFTDVLNDKGDRL